MEFVPRFSARTALAITLGWVLLLAATGATEALLFMAPALLIAVPLVAGRYVGEELIARLAARRARRPRPRRAIALPAPAKAPVFPPRGARLIAHSLAKRPPPAVALTHT